MFTCHLYEERLLYIILLNKLICTVLISVTANFKIIECSFEIADESKDNSDTIRCRL